jgi:hypothetical protein
MIYKDKIAGKMQWNIHVTELSDSVLLATDRLSRCVVKREEKDPCVRYIFIKLFNEGKSSLGATIVG